MIYTRTGTQVSEGLNSVETEKYETTYYSINAVSEGLNSVETH